LLGAEPLKTVFIVFGVIDPGAVPFLISEYICPFVAPVEANTTTQLPVAAVNVPVGI
jgi:hypothetical protein